MEGSEVKAGTLWWKASI